jgi:acetolactate synthase-1/3 small subunit
VSPAVGNQPAVIGTQAEGTPPRHHIVTAHVENKAGVLARVASLFSRRGFNIFSLAVAPTDDDRFSRITIVVDVESAPLEQIVNQLDKLVNVVRITELAPDEAVECEMLLVTIEAGPDRRDQMLAHVQAFGATVVDEGTGLITVMLAGTPSTIDEFENLVRPFGITELQRTGRVALPKLGPGAARGRAAAPLRSITGAVQGEAG